MFEQLIESSPSAVPTRRPLTFGLALMLHLTALGILILVIPLFPETLPSQLRALPSLLAPLPPPPPPPKGTHQHPPKPAPIITETRTLTSPSSVPTGTARIADQKPIPLDEPEGLPWGVLGGIKGGLRNGILNNLLVGAGINSQILPPAVPDNERQSAQPVLHVLVGGEIQKANLIYQVRPVYPILARQARIQGVVRLAAVISPEGSVEDVQVVSGHPLLLEAAVEAVKQWKYRPTLLNGRPVRVETTITVNFSLSN